MIEFFEYKGDIIVCEIIVVQQFVYIKEVEFIGFDGIFVL